MREKNYRDRYMHAFESLVSMEVVIRSSSSPLRSPSLSRSSSLLRSLSLSRPSSSSSSSEIEMISFGSEDRGWVPSEYLQIHLSLLTTMLAKVVKSDQQNEFVAGQIEITKKWIKLKFEDLTRLLNEYSHTSQEKLSYDSYEENDRLYGDCESGGIEIKKILMVKNLLAHIEQGALDFYGLQKGMEVYREFYLGLVQSALFKANKYAMPMPGAQLLSIEEVAEKIKNSQKVFTDIPSAEILSSDIVKLYNNLTNKIQSQSPTRIVTSTSFSPPLSPSTSSPIKDDSFSSSLGQLMQQLPIPLPLGGMFG